jgi:predicted nucleotidyltransferase
MVTETQSVVSIDIPYADVVELCHKYHIQRLALFGSVLRPDFNQDSDIDILVEFEPGHVPGLAFFHVESELSELLRRQVDLNTPSFLSPSFRNQVLAEAVVLYEQAQ